MRVLTPQRLAVVLAGIAVAATATATGSTAAASTTAVRPAPVASAKSPTGMFTILFGRTQWSAADRVCVPLPNAVNLGRVAVLLQERGHAATGNVVVKRQGQDRSCFSNYVVQPSWNDLTQLRTRYGWTFTSAGMNYVDMTKLTPVQQHAEACGSIGALARRGHSRAWGLFAYPNNKYTDTIQRQVVSTCFAFGRRYGFTTTPKTLATTPPNWQNTISVNGGKCSDTTLPCSEPAGRTYLTPDKLIPYTKVLAGSWTTMQWYRFVTGVSAPGTGAKWNCQGPASSHWTSDAELYCISDFLRVVDAIPGTVTVTDPATVAESWGVG